MADPARPWAEDRVFRPFRGHFRLGATPLRHVGRLRFPEDIRHEHPSDSRSTPVLNGVSDWLTYAEAGARFGVSAEAVRQLAMRRKWPRRRPNDDPFGRVQVLIPDHTEIKPRTGVQHPDERPSDARPIAELDTQRDALEHERERADRAEMTADLERERADQAEILRQQATQRAEAADADRRAADTRVAEAEADRRVAEARADDERARSDALRERLEAMQAQLAMAEAEAKAAHDRAGMSGEQQAAAEQRAAADRERADRTEASAAHERQSFLDVEVLTRRELDTLREQLAEAEKGREVAEAAVLQAARTADEALQIAAARQRLGLVARLRAAWRGD